MFVLSTYLDERIKLVETQLGQYLNFTNETAASAKLHEAMRYSVFAGGKRLRPILCILAAEAAGDYSNKVLPAACAIELLHTYSLIHDDLPCMDDDEFRRGKLTCHKKFGENIAVLAGDALLTLAFEILGRELQEIEPLVVLRVVLELAQAAGCEGMVAGQVMDLLSEHKILSQEQLKILHKQKTGALIEVSLKIGALIAGATPEATGALSKYGEALGLGFQITDDILDEIGNAQYMGKLTGRDKKQEKATYIKLLGLNKSRELADQVVQQAKLALKDVPGNILPLECLADYIIQRES